MIDDACIVAVADLVGRSICERVDRIVAVMIVGVIVIGIVRVSSAVMEPAVRRATASVLGIYGIGVRWWCWYW